MEEIGTLFGDESHVASHWYGISEEEKQKIAENALQLTKSGRIPDTSEIRAAMQEDNSNQPSGPASEKNDDQDDEAKVERVEGQQV